MLCRSRLLSIVAITLVCGLTARADVTVHKMFSDHMVLQRDLAVPIWGTAAAGEKISVSFRDQTQQAVADKEGKWTLKLDPLKVGDAAELTVKGTNTVVFKDVLVGEVWIGSGQSNMAGGVRGYAKNDAVLAKWAAGGPYPNLRLYRGGWKVAETKTIEAFSAIHFSFGFRLHQELKVPVGLMVGAVGGTPSGRWLSPAMAAADKALVAKLGSIESLKAKHAEAVAKWVERAKKAKADGKKAPRKPRGPIRIGDLYARNIEYMVPYGIRGVLWDQGESKTQLPGVDQFTTMNALIIGWRNVWGQGDFYFLHVQKPSGGRAAFDPANPVNLKAVAFAASYPKDHNARPSVLEYPLSHLKLVKIKNAPIVTACDLAPGIHPQTKSSYGHRACRVALGAVYGKDVAICGPVYKSHKVEGATLRVSFDHIGKGLAFKHADTVRGFEIAGSDGKWAWADAKIDGETIVLSSKDVPKPTMVQFAFNRKNSFANLYNKDGLPALMFTTAGDPVGK
jgi:sialate O-acetylesterase